MVGPTALTSTQMSDSKMNQNRSQPSLNAVPSGHSNAVGNKDKFSQNFARDGGNGALSTSMNMPAHQSNGDLA